MGAHQITEPDRRGRKPKEESRAEEFHEKLAAWSQMPESARPSLRELAHQFGTSELLLSHYRKTQDEWEANRQAAKCHASGDARGYGYWTIRAWAFKDIRRMERKFNKTGALDKWSTKFLELHASTGISGARGLLAKATSKK